MAPEQGARTPVTLKTAALDAMSKNERIKVESRGLFFVGDAKGSHAFGAEVDALARGEVPTLSNVAKELSKFFGIYKQQLREERGRKTGDHVFMVRIKCPAGGELEPQQWAALDEGCERFGDGTLRVTSRQGVQFHRVYGPRLAQLVRHLNRGYRRDATLGACGDVNRNVMTSPLDGLDPRHDPRGRELALEIAEALAPKSSAYFQAFLSDDAGRSVAPLNPDEPLYGEHYLPRKFKIGIGHPTDNSVDVLTQDVGFVPLVTNGRCDGSVFDLYSGGGLGLTHNNPGTAALLGLYFGRIRREQVVDVARAIAVLQKENGERRDRRQARWKYTLRRLSLPAVKAELKQRFGIEIEEGEPQPLAPMELHLGWQEGRDGLGHYGVSVENGRIGAALRGALREAVDGLGLGVRFTPQQDVLLTRVRDRAALERILDARGVPRPESVSRVRRNAMACPAKPTCGLAMTDAENVLPHYLDALEAEGLGDVDAVIRMTGCPNNCARPPTAEIGIYGYGKNDHVILVGGSRENGRLAHLLYERIPEERMIPALVGLFRAIRDRNAEGLPVGEFLHRTPPERLRGWIGVEDGSC
jgi:sulfite reductase (ferredoxin)